MGTIGPRVVDTTRSRTAPQYVIDRVLAKADRIGDCLVSRYGVAGGGYPYARWMAYGRMVAVPAHRIVWQAAYGPIRDPDLVIERTCGNLRCVEVAHMRASRQTRSSVSP